MKKTLLSAAILCFGILAAQNNKLITPAFDEAKALQNAKARGLASVDYKGYIEHQRQHWLKENGLLSPSLNTATKKNYNTITSAGNVDFETGDYSGWQLSVGENTVSSNGPLVGVRPVINPGAIDALPLSTCGNAFDSLRHGLMTNLNATDAMSGIPLTSPLGGNYIARLNRYCAGSEAAVLTQNFAVTASVPYLNYVYAVVLEDGSHMWGEQTYFMIKVRDQANNLIDSVYMQAANGTTPGFYPVGSLYPNTYYKPWTPVSINLTAYIGQNVSIEVTAADCIYGGHSGYAYFDAKLDSASMPNVWPGDANYDLTADLNDLFYIGWGYGAYGPIRSGATNNWQAEPCADWGQTTAYGTEFKHADCNGDGIIGDDDTLAVIQNYGLIHPFRLSNPAPATLSNYRNLTITPSAATVGPNQALTLSIGLPATTNTATTNDLYGIAFRLYLPQAYITSLTSTNFTSFLGIKGTNMLTLCKASVGSGYIDYSLSRKDHTNATTSGNLLDINLLTSSFSIDATANFSIANIKAVNYQGASLNIGSTDVPVNFSSTTGIRAANSTEIKIMPNPATDKISFDGLADAKINIEVVNVIGETILKTNLDGKKSIDVSEFQKGAYFIKLYTTQGLVIKKFIKE
jgi:hypothetical protein